MKYFQTVNGYKIYNVLNIRANSFLVIYQNFSVLVDTGMLPEYKILRYNIDKILGKERKLDYLLLTHTHFDHCKNAAEIKKKYNCKIITSARDSVFVEQGYTIIPKGIAWWAKILSPAAAAFGKKLFGYKPFSSDIKIETDKQFIFLESVDIKIINTPGHTNGSVSLIVDNEIAIAGDALFSSVFINKILPPFADNIAETVKSWKILLNTGCNLFLPGHGKPVERKTIENQYKKYFQKYSL